MRVCFIVLLFAQAATCQDGFPKSDFGSPAGFTAQASVDEIRRLQIESLETAQEAAQEQWAAGIVDLSTLLAISDQLREARLAMAADPVERQAIADQAIRQLDEYWYRAKRLLDHGARGGSVSEVAMVRAALLTTIKRSGEPSTERLFYPLAEEDDLVAAILSAWETADAAAKERYTAGLDPVNQWMRIRQQRAEAIAEFTGDKLQAYHIGLTASLKILCRERELQKVRPGVEAPLEAMLAKAEAFEFLAAWLKAGGDQHTRLPDTPCPDLDLGSPRDYQAALRLAVEAYREAAEEAKRRLEAGLARADLFWSINLVLQKTELQLAQTKQERLDTIENSLQQALSIWGRANAMRQAQARGGDTRTVAFAAGQVFGLRGDWLEEKAKHELHTQQSVWQTVTCVLGFSSAQQMDTRSLSATERKSILDSSGWIRLLFFSIPSPLNAIGHEDFVRKRIAAFRSLT